MLPALILRVGTPEYRGEHMSAMVGAQEAGRAAQLPGPGRGPAGKSHTRGTGTTAVHQEKERISPLWRPGHHKLLCF